MLPSAMSHLPEAISRACSRSPPAGLCARFALTPASHFLGERLALVGDHRGDQRGIVDVLTGAERTDGPSNFGSARSSYVICLPSRAPSRRTRYGHACLMRTSGPAHRGTAPARWPLWRHCRPAASGLHPWLQTGDPTSTVNNRSAGLLGPSAARRSLRPAEA